MSNNTMTKTEMADLLRAVATELTNMAEEHDRKTCHASEVRLKLITSADIAIITTMKKVADAITTAADGLQRPPLFIPLTAEYYDQFAAGTKFRELRPYGARWNEQTCARGRQVTLSRGYGRQKRMTGSISAFSKLDFTQLSPEDQAAFMAVYNRSDIPVAVISITNLHAATRKETR